MIVETFTKRYIKCPYCNDNEWLVDHIFENSSSFGPWWCKNCKRGIYGKVVDGKIEIDETFTKKDESEECVVLLEYQMDERLFLEVRSVIFEPNNLEWYDRQVYYHEQHTCPTNILRNVREMYVKDEPDHHGAFRLIAVKRNVKLDDYGVRHFEKEVKEELVRETLEE